MVSHLASRSVAPGLDHTSAVAEQVFSPNVAADAFLVLGEALVDLDLRAARGRARRRDLASRRTSAEPARTSPSTPPGRGLACRWRAAPATTRGGAGCSSACRTEGVGTDYFALAPGARRRSPSRRWTAAGEPSFAIYGAGHQRGAGGAGDRIDEAVETSEGPLVRLQHARRAGEGGHAARPRAARWSSAGPRASTRTCAWSAGRARQAAAAAARECVEGCFLVKANANEARLLTGEDDPGRGRRGDRGDGRAARGRHAAARTAPGARRRTPKMSPAARRR